MILVTGAVGVVGQPLCNELDASARGYISVSRSAQDGSNRLQWDLSRVPTPSQLAKISACDELIHCAPIWLLPKQFITLVEAGIKRVVAFSSTSVIAKKSSSDPHEAKLVFALEQAESQLRELAFANNISLTILRPTMIYGYGLDENISHIAAKIKRLKVMPLAGESKGLRQPVNSDDLVKAALAVLANNSAGTLTYNLGGGETLTYRAMVERIFLALDIKPRFVFIPLWMYRPVLRLLGALGSFHYTASMADRMNLDLVYDHEEASRDFGYLPGNFLLNPERDLPR